MSYTYTKFMTKCAVLQTIDIYHSRWNSSKPNGETIAIVVY